MVWPRATLAGEKHGRRRQSGCKQWSNLYAKWKLQRLADVYEWQNRSARPSRIICVFVYLYRAKLQTHFLVQNGTIRVMCFQSHLVLFIQWIKTCSFGCQSYYHFGRGVYLAAQRQYHCIVFGFGILFPFLPLCFPYIPMCLSRWMCSIYVCWTVFCTFVRAVQSVLFSVE